MGGSSSSRRRRRARRTWCALTRSWRSCGPRATPPRSTTSSSRSPLAPSPTPPAPMSAHPLPSPPAYRPPSADSAEPAAGPPPSGSLFGREPAIRRGAVASLSLAARPRASRRCLRACGTHVSPRSGTGIYSRCSYAAGTHTLHTGTGIYSRCSPRVCPRHTSVAREVSGRSLRAAPRRRAGRREAVRRGSRVAGGLLGALGGDCCVIRGLVDRFSCLQVGYSELFATCSHEDIRVWNSRTCAELLRVQASRRPAARLCRGADWTCVRAAGGGVVWLLVCAMAA